jgi:recombination protein U
MDTTYINHSNLGMYLELIINRTCEFYASREVALIEKREVPIKILKIIKDNTIIGKIMSKSSIDYFGSKGNIRFEFEAKETKFDYFDLHLIKEHQFAYMKKLLTMNIKCYIFVHFQKFEEIYLLDFKWIDDYIVNKGKKKIDYATIKEQGNKLEIMYPGIIDFISLIN